MYLSPEVKMILIMPPHSLIFSQCSLGLISTDSVRTVPLEFHFSQPIPHLSNRTAWSAALQAGRSDITVALAVDCQNHQWQVMRHFGTDRWWEIVAVLKCKTSRSLPRCLPDDRLVANICCEMLILIHRQTFQQWLQHLL